ncbi:MAG: hypothetical protein LC663_06260 [Actinobacteria bacterium]|nr:hypothetical protein [Actinomycetota bacterium]
MKFRSRDRLRNEHVGKRVTVRRRLGDGTLGDVIGVLEAIDAEKLVLRDRTDTALTIDVATVVAARVIG